MKSMVRWFLWTLLFSQLGWVELACARGTVLIVGFQPDGRLAEHAEQAVSARLKRFAEVSLLRPRTPPEPEILSCETAACLMPVALRESADFVLLGRVASSEHARLARVYLLHVGRQELLSDEAGCEECNERTVVDLAASVAATLLEKALPLPALTATPTAPACPSCPVCASCPPAHPASRPPLAPKWQALAGVLGVLAVGTFTAAVSLSVLQNKPDCDGSIEAVSVQRCGNHFNNWGLVGTLYPVSAVLLGGLVLTLTIPTRGAK